VLPRAAGLWAWLISCVLAGVLAGETIAQPALPEGFVYLRDVDPSIAQDMRYAGPNNFVGRPLPGYEAAECVLRSDAALALKQVQADLAPSGLGLKVYDCYRPARAVRAMAQWVHDGQDGAATKRFFPKLQKSALFSLGYIASPSAHSTGTAVDLALMDKSRQAAARLDPRRTLAPCTAPAAERDADGALDMGTSFDCFDVASHTASPAATPEQRRWRSILVATMAARGFKNYHREWWHFAYASSRPAWHWDVPIRVRERAAARP
jgi:D-alanyl-D-alanine dipeptidase